MAEEISEWDFDFSNADGDTWDEIDRISQNELLKYKNVRDAGEILKMNKEELEGGKGPMIDDTYFRDSETRSPGGLEKNDLGLPVKEKYPNQLRSEEDEDQNIAA